MRGIVAGEGLRDEGWRLGWDTGEGMTEGDLFDCNRLWRSEERTSHPYEREAVDGCFAPSDFRNQVAHVYYCCCLSGSNPLLKRIIENSAGIHSI